MERKRELSEREIYIENNFYKPQRLTEIDETYEEYTRRRKLAKWAIKIHSYGKKKQ